MALPVFHAPVSYAAVLRMFNYNLLWAIAANLPVQFLLKLLPAADAAGPAALLLCSIAPVDVLETAASNHLHLLLTSGALKIKT